MYEENVRRGVALLDEKGVPDWRQKVDTRQLDMNSHYKCVLGQIYGSYGQGLLELGLQSDFFFALPPDESSMHNGFSVECCKHPESCETAIDEFNNQWLKVLGETNVHGD